MTSKCETSGWSFARIGRFARRTKKKERLLVVHDFFDLFFNLFEEVWLSRDLNRLTRVIRQIRGDSKSRDLRIALLRPKVVGGRKNNYEIMHLFRDKIGRASS